MRNQKPVTSDQKTESRKFFLVTRYSLLATFILICLILPHTACLGQTTGLGVIYHKSTFSYKQLPGFDYYDPFPPSEPCAYIPEKGQWGWVNAEIYGGNMWLVPDPTDSSRAALCMAFDISNHSGDNRHVKLYELQGREFNNKGANPNYNVEPYISDKKAYYHFKIWFPENTVIASWRLIWQICGAEEDYLGISIPDKENGPQFRLVFEGNNLNAVMNGGYYSDLKNRRWTVTTLQDLPKNQWIGFIVLFEQGSSFREEDGTVIVWIDGERKFERHDLPTATQSGTPFLVWGIGNYGSPQEPDGQVQLFKDVMVTSEFPESLPALLGDVNGDGSSNIIDVTLTARHVAELSRLQGDALRRANVNGDVDGSGQSKIDILDVILIARRAVGLITSF